MKKCPVPCSSRWAPPSRRFRYGDKRRFRVCTNRFAFLKLAQVPQLEEYEKRDGLGKLEFWEPISVRWTAPFYFSLFLFILFYLLSYRARALEFGNLFSLFTLGRPHGSEEQKWYGGKQESKSKTRCFVKHLSTLGYLLPFSPSFVFGRRGC